MNVFTLILVFPVCNRDSSVRLRDAELLHHTHTHTHTHTHAHTHTRAHAHTLPRRAALCWPESAHLVEQNGMFSTAFQNLEQLGMTASEHVWMSVCVCVCVCVCVRVRVRVRVSVCVRKPL